MFQYDQEVLKQEFQLLIDKNKKEAIATFKQLET
jgi:hypothetical protein